MKEENNTRRFQLDQVTGESAQVTKTACSCQLSDITHCIVLYGGGVELTKLGDREEYELWGSINQQLWKDAKMH
jgi:hypothetical protein